ATRTMPDRRFRVVGRIGWRRSCQQSSAEGKQRAAPAIGQNAEIANARKTPRKNMFQEAAQKLVMSQRHLPPFAAMGIVFPEERPLAVGDINQPMIGDRHTMRVPRQVMQHVLGSTEGTLGVDHPVFSKQRAEKGMKRLLVCQ